jgi:hypothetical protein
MGLLRRRPEAVPSDSAFLAFARLSLANDTDRLLERMISVLPAASGGGTPEDWLMADDHWGANLWDIEPICQVAGIGSRYDHAKETVILDGCLSANIRWKGFKPVAYARKVTWARRFVDFILRFLGFPAFAVGAGVLGIPWTPGVVVLLFGMGFMFASPKLARIKYGGKIWRAQPWLFGFEGHLPIDRIESMIFGTYEGRLTWSPAGGPFSLHELGEDGRRKGTDPALVDEYRQAIDAAKSGQSEEKIFTLVDTNTMTATLFAAKTPPIVALICGQEGGMLRAALCGYDWTTQTLYRETVVRMESDIRDKMFRIGRVKFGFRRPELPRSGTGVSLFLSPKPIGAITRN